MEFGVTANCELVGHSMKLRVGFALENVGLRLLYMKMSACVFCICFLPTLHNRLTRVCRFVNKDP